MDVRKETLTVEERPASVHTIKSDVSKSLIIFCSRGDMEGCSFWLPSKTENARPVFVKDDIFEIGKTKMEYRGLVFSIYGQERLLVDLIRTKSKLPFDYYKEIIGSLAR